CSDTSLVSVGWLGPVGGRHLEGAGDREEHASGGEQGDLVARGAGHVDDGVEERGELPAHVLADLGIARGGVSLKLAEQAVALAAWKPCSANSAIATRSTCSRRSSALGRVAAIVPSTTISRL